MTDQKSYKNNSFAAETRYGAAFHLGEMSLNTMNYPEARKYLIYCMALNPKHRKAKKYLRTLEK